MLTLARFLLLIAALIGALLIVSYQVRALQPPLGQLLADIGLNERADEPLDEEHAKLIKQLVQVYELDDDLEFIERELLRQESPSKRDIQELKVIYNRHLFNERLAAELSNILRASLRQDENKKQDYHL